MPNGRATTVTNAEAVNAAYALSLLSEYGYTLDSLPLELSRTFADLRELDAVLSTSMITITAKIQRLTAMIEQGNAPGAGRREERLYLLAEIAEEAQRLKPGGEDKIRVACQAADALKANALHLAALMDHVPGQEYDVAVMSRNTTYPHVATRNWAVPHAYESRGKRRAAAPGQLILHGSNEVPSPKKRRTGRDDDDPSYGRSPRKDKSDKQQRNNARAKKCVLHTALPDLIVAHPVLPS
jgi:inhibitor of growth protein 3